jgi:kumamolisin
VSRSSRLFIFSLGLLCLFSTTGLFAQTAQTRRVNELVANGKVQPVGRLASEQMLQLDLVLPVRDSAAHDAFLADLYDSTSPNYRHFLNVQQFTEQFAPRLAITRLWSILSVRTA